MGQKVPIITRTRRPLNLTVRPTTKWRTNRAQALKGTAVTMEVLEMLAAETMTMRPLYSIHTMVMNSRLPPMTPICPLRCLLHRWSSLHLHPVEAFSCHSEICLSVKSIVRFHFYSKHAIPEAPSTDYFLRRFAVVWSRRECVPDKKFLLYIRRIRSYY